MSQSRQLAAILFTDIEGYTALMQENEHQAVRLIKHYDDSLNALVGLYHGRILNNYGDGSLCSFASVANAIDFAIDLQKELRKDPVVPLRVGLHIGEVFFEGDKALGDAVNVASRIQSLGQANTILFSKEVLDKVRNRPELKAVSLGHFHFKNVQEPIEVFALANEGLVVPKRQKMEGKLKEQSGFKKKWILAITVLAFVAIAILLYRELFGKLKFTGTEKSIAVLPFKYMSSDKENEWFSDGMTDDIITQLYKITSLRVMSRTSSMTYKASNKTIDKIAAELNVASLLEGSVEKLGNRLRINVQLIDGKSGVHIWAEIYDRNINDLFDIQTEVAQLIATQLNAKLTDSEKSRIAQKPTQSLEAYNQYSKGRYYYNKGNDSAFIAAINFFKKAVELDPSYAKAYSGLADCYSARGYASTISPAEAFLTAERYASKALELDSTLAEPHTSLGYISFYFYWNWTESERHFQKAIALNPQYDLAYDSYAYYLTAMERFPEAKENLDKAVTISPRSAKYATDMGFSFYYGHDFDQATKVLKSAIELNPKYVLSHIWLARVYQEQNMFKEAIQEYQNSLKITPRWAVPIGGIGYVYGISGQKAEAEKYLAKLKEYSSSQYITPYAVALVYTSLGDKDNAFQWLEKSFVDRTNWLVWLKLDRRWNPLKSDPRFDKLLERIKLPRTSLVSTAAK
ncbi:MAG: tetratricopeptide repeat protein [Chitinophagales bacterium]